MSVAIIYSMTTGLMTYGLVVISAGWAKNILGLSGIIIGVIGMFILAVFQVRDKRLVRQEEKDLWIVLRVLQLPDPEGYVVWLAS